jgi:isopentenyl-diphosphate delta-isomerase
MASPAVTAARAYLATVDLSSYDKEQSRLMQERCILVDENDNAIGAVDKKTCKPVGAPLSLVMATDN